MSKLYKIVTLGCKVNQYESAFIEESLLKEGCKMARTDEEADLFIINGCIVTARASYQTRQAIRRGIRENPGAVVAVVGCYGQVFPGELAEIEGVHLIAGNKGRRALPGHLVHAAHRNPPLILSEDFEASLAFEELPVRSFTGRTRAFLKIQDGCESFCSYCIVPMARGPLRSLKPRRVIDLVRDFENSGYKEIVLTGTHLGTYGSDLGNGLDLARLLIEIGKNRSHVRVRLSSIEPTEIGDDLVEFMAGHDWLCRHLHIPLQSGDNSVLQRMNRHYTAEMCARLIGRIHRLVPRVSIGVDVMAGFPGETDRAFNHTLGLLEGLPISYLHVFPYSRREGTAAARFPDHLHQGTITERAALLRRLDREKRRMFREALLGQSFQVLAEGWVPGGTNLIRGLSDNYVRFSFRSLRPVSNDFVRVRAVEVNDQGMMGTPIEG
jgi:threonylcarbamoyladenosine tRNA methylthiotransferase MtaB